MWVVGLLKIIFQLSGNLCMFWFGFSRTWSQMNGANNILWFSSGSKSESGSRLSSCRKLRLLLKAEGNFFYVIIIKCFIFLIPDSLLFKVTVLQAKFSFLIIVFSCQREYHDCYHSGLCCNVRVCIQNLQVLQVEFRPYGSTSAPGVYEVRRSQAISIKLTSVTSLSVQSTCMR